MNSHYLRRTEIVYELKIRGIATDGNVDVLRKKLTSCFSKNVEVNSEIVAKLDSAEEVEICEEKLSDLEELVNEYEGNTMDNEYRRINARLLHWHGRVERIPVPTSSDSDFIERHGKLLGKIKTLMDCFCELEGPSKKLGDIEDECLSVDSLEGASEVSLRQQMTRIDINEKPPMQTTRSAPKEVMKPRTSIPTGTDQPLKGQREVGGFVTKPVPVHKWGLKFNGDGSQSVSSFIERAEELSRARGISLQELYESAVDLFSGAALIWYRSACQRISSWEELKKELKLVFQSADYDDRLLLEILNRTQGESESLDLYLAAMDGLFRRLSSPVPDEAKLQRILRNVNTYLQDKLCMFEIKSIDELRHLGRKAELGKIRSSNHHPPSRPVRVLEPDLAWNPSRQKANNGNVDSISHNGDLQTPNQILRRPLLCWNCGKEGHTHRTCQEKKKLFCYGCGESGTKKDACNKCMSKNS